MKIVLLIVLLITNTICADDCISLSTEETCKAKSGCKWTAGITCSGDDSCTSKTASESECTGTTYKPQLACTYTPGSPATCTGDSACSTVTSLGDGTACGAKKYGGTQCTYTPADPANDVEASCGPDTECNGVDITEGGETCSQTYYGQSSCVYTAAVEASCTGSSDCTGVSDLSTATECVGTTYDGASTQCVYATGTCAADTTTNTEPENGNSGYIKFSILFSLLYLLL